MSSNQQTRLSKCISYLQERHLYECANAVQRAAGQVNCYQNNQNWRRVFSQAVNNKLCEALLIMNCDPNCDTRNLKHVRTLIENYREMNGLPATSYDIPDVPVTAEVIEYGDGPDYGSDEYDIEEVDDCRVEDCIKNMCSRGGYLSYEQICDDMAECEEDELAIMDALKELVRQGHFEVTSRNPYSGQIDMVMKIR